MATKFSDSKGRYVKAQSKKTRADKSNELKESIGSLDRRVQKLLGRGIQIKRRTSVPGRINSPPS